MKYFLKEQIEQLKVEQWKCEGVLYVQLSRFLEQIDFGLIGNILRLMDVSHHSI
jgi:hypothetical protein